MSGTASPKTTRTFCTDEGTLVATARPDEDADAADAEAVDDEVELEVLLAMLMDEEPDAELELVKSSWFVTIAVKPVTFWQLEPTVLLTPWTKLTGAH